MGSWRNRATRDIYYKKGLNGVIEQVTQTASRSSEPSIDLDASKNVHVVWSELDMSIGDMDVRYTNSTIWPATNTSGYLNVSDIVENQLDDLRPDIAIDMVGRPHVTYFENRTPNDFIYYAFSPNANNTLFWNAGDISPHDANCIYPSIKVSAQMNPVIIYQGQKAQTAHTEIYAVDYNGSWTPIDLSNNAFEDNLEYSSIGALAIDGNDKLYVTYYSSTGDLYPNMEIFVVEGNIKGNGIPGFELIYLVLAASSLALIWVFYKRISIERL
jgi:hypothetical protein